MTDWGLAVNVFITGVLGVMVVMFLLQVTIQLTSAIIRYFEKSDEKVEAKG